MAEPIFSIPDLSKSRILITNDDGIQAKGIGVLERIARKLSDDVWVVAPEVEQSGTSHSLTLRRPLRMRRSGSDKRYAVDGTPTDSVLMGVCHVLKDHKPDLVLSGVNRGGNLGDDVTYSGTIAAAMEGCLLGIPSIALSLMVALTGSAKWDTAEKLAPELIRKLTSNGFPRGVFVNVNFPDLPAEAVKGTKVVRLGQRKIGSQLEQRFDPRGAPYYWIGPLREEDRHVGDTDISVVHDGYVSVTPVHLDLTDKPTLATMQGTL